MKNLSNKGFTLAELIIVVILLTVMSALAFTGYMSKQDRAKHAQVKNNMFDIQCAVEEFYVRAGGVYPGDLSTRIITANPLYNGDDINLCVAWADLPPYGPNSILREHVRNPFRPGLSTWMDGPAVGLGTVGYQASSTPGDDPVTGAPWTEAGDGPAIMYRITGIGKMGFLPITLIQLQ